MCTSVVTDVVHQVFNMFNIIKKNGFWDEI